MCVPLYSGRPTRRHGRLTMVPGAEGPYTLPAFGRWCPCGLAVRHMGVAVCIVLAHLGMARRVPKGHGGGHGELGPQLAHVVPRNRHFHAIAPRTLPECCSGCDDLEQVLPVGSVVSSFTLTSCIMSWTVHS